MPELGAVFDVKEVAKYLGMHEGTARRLAREGKIPAYRVGGVWRFNRDQLDRWAQEQQPPTGRRLVLAIDDDEDILKIIRRALEPRGFKVITVPTGAEALELMKRGTPDVVLLDLKIPDMEGAEILREIRSNYGDLPVVVVTAYPDSDMMQRALEYSPFTLLAKPVGTKLLLQTVRLALGQPRT